MFCIESSAPPPRWPGIVASVVLHLVLVLALPHLTRDRRKSPAELAAERNERILRTIRIRIPEQLYLAASGPAVRRKQPVVFKATPKDLKPQAPAPGASGRAPRRRFELPPVAQRAASDQSLLQPGHLLTPAAGLQLPELFFWSPPLPRPPVKPFVQPGHSRPPAQAARLDAPPRLALPGFDVASLPAQTPAVAAALTLPPPPSAPIRTAISDNPAPSGSISDRTAGDPATVLALSASSMPLREYVSVPPGNQVGRTPGAVPDGSLAGSGDGGAGGSGGSGGSGGGSGGSGRGEGGALAGGPGGSAAASGPPRMAGASVLAIEASRKSFPNNGVFDVVVQSAGPESLTESAGVLSGKPVYSVYLQLGGRKDWIMQYCVPAGDAAAPSSTSGGVVRLAGPVRLTAPYPLLTYRPPLTHSASRYLMLHGFVSAEGKFADLRPIGAHEPSEALLAISILGRWEFRPATQDGKPVRVEILLAIPGE